MIDQTLQKFLNEKLAEYNRLWYKYGGRAQTTDERALLLMLRFQRRKMERSLYPGLLTRMVYRAIVMARAAVRPKQADKRREDKTQPYLYSTIPVSAAVRRNGREQPSQEQTATARHRKHHGYNLGRRQQQAHGKRKGPSL